MSAAKASHRFQVTHIISFSCTFFLSIALEVFTFPKAVAQNTSDA